jgi:hypothetical protein
MRVAVIRAHEFARSTFSFLRGTGRIAYRSPITKFHQSERSARVGLVLATAIAVVALVCPGCGGGGDASGGGERTYSVEANTTVLRASPPITKAQFVKQVNRHCRWAWKKILSNWHVYKSIQEKGLSEQRTFAEAAQQSLLAGITFYVFDVIHDRGVPKREEAEIETMIGAMQYGTEQGWKDESLLASVAEIVDLYGEFNERALRYGLDDCLVSEAHLRPLEAS